MSKVSFDMNETDDEKSKSPNVINAGVDNVPVENSVSPTGSPDSENASAITSVPAVTPPASADSAKSSSTRFLSNLSMHEIGVQFVDIGANYTTIIPIGFPGAGKSMFLSSLMRYAKSGEGSLFSCNFEVNYPFAEGLKTLDRMVANFERGQLNAVTQKGSLDIFGLKITPNNKKLPQHKMCFLDLAGEDIKNIKTENTGAFPARIRAVLEGLKIDKSPIIFTLITPYSPGSGRGVSANQNHQLEDQLHFDFVNFLQMSQPEILNNSMFYVVVSQWDKNPDSTMDVEDFISNNRPSLYRLIKDKNVIWGHYSAGKVLESEDDAGNVSAQLVVRNDEYPRNFWASLYKVCANEDLDKKSFWDKLFS